MRDQDIPTQYCLNVYDTLSQAELNFLSDREFIKTSRQYPKKGITFFPDGLEILFAYSKTKRLYIPISKLTPMISVHRPAVIDFYCDFVKQDKVRKAREASEMVKFHGKLI